MANIGEGLASGGVVCGCMVQYDSCFIWLTGDGIWAYGLGGGGACAWMETGGGGGAKSPREVSTHRERREPLLLRGFPVREQGPPVLPSSLSESVGATALEAELEVRGSGLTRQVERGGACWS